MDELRNEYYLKQQKKYLRVSTTIDGTQPLVGSTAQCWRFVEVEPQEMFDVTARRRMIEGFLKALLVSLAEPNGSQLLTLS